MCAQRRRTRKGRPRQPAPKTLPDDLYSYDDEPAPTRQRRNSLLDAIDGENFSVTDDWPDDVPVTEAEIEVFERWFGDVFDELLSPKKLKDGLPFLSQTDRKKA
ncbi:hypothetical protein [Alsobacter sp. R-9]